MANASRTSSGRYVSRLTGGTLAMIMAGGRGERLLAFAEARARKNGHKSLFVLSTRTTHWFIEHGFTLASPEDLPAARKEMYNWQRRSKVLVKTLA